MIVASSGSEYALYQRLLGLSEERAWEALSLAEKLRSRLPLPGLSWWRRLAAWMRPATLRALLECRKSRGAGASDEQRLIADLAVCDEAVLTQVEFMVDAYWGFRHSARRQPDDQPALAPQRRLGNYALFESLAGGMGVVYRAWQDPPGREVALKLIGPRQQFTPEAQQRFRREARLAGKLDHPGLVPVLEAGEAAGELYYAMPFVRGPNLRQALHERGRFSPRTAAALIRSVAYAVHYAHKRDVVHRDLKPENILLDRSSPGIDGLGLPRVTDFGVAGSHYANRPEDAQAGTLAYKEPAQHRPRRRPDARMDVYALGVILFELLTGGRPFSGQTDAELYEQKCVPPERQPALGRGSVADEDVRAIVLKCLQPRREPRYSTALALAQDLERYLHGMPVAARPIAWGERAWKFARRRPALAALLTVSVLAAATLTITLWASNFIIAGKNKDLSKALEDEAAARASAESQLAETLHANAERFISAGDYLAALPYVAGQLDGSSKSDAAGSEALRMKLSGLIRRSPRLLSAWGFDVPIRKSLISDDGRSAVVITEGRQIQVYDAFSGEARAAWECADGLSWPEWMVLSPDDRQLCLAQYGSYVVYDVATGEEIVVANALSYPHQIKDVVYGPAGFRVVTVDGAQVQVFDLAGQRAVTAPLVLPSRVFSAVLSPDGKSLVTMRDAGHFLVQVWDLTASQPQGEKVDAPPDSSSVNPLVFSPDGRRFCVFGSTITVYDTAARRRIGEPFPTRGSASRVLFSPNGEQLLTIGWNEKAAQVWDLNGSQAAARSLLHEAPILAGSFSPDGQWAVLASQDGVVRAWDTATGEPQTAPVRHGQAVKFASSPDARRLLTLDVDGIARLWDAQAGELGATTLDLDQYLGPLAISPDGRRVAGSEGAQVFSYVLPAPASLATSPGKPPAIQEESPLGHDNEVTHLTFSPTGDRLVTAGKDRTARIWNTANQKPVTPPLPHEGDVLHAVFSSQGDRVATASADGSAQVWDAQTGRPLTKPLVHRVKSLDLDFSDYDEFVQAVDERLKMLDELQALYEQEDGDEPEVTELLDHAREYLETLRDEKKADKNDLQILGELTKQMAKANGNPVVQVAFSADGRRLYTASRESLQIWNLASQQPAEPQKTIEFAPGESASEVQFHPAAGLAVAIFSTGSRYVTRVWDLDSERELTSLVHTGAINQAAISRDGRLIATASDDSTVRLAPTKAGVSPLRELRHGAPVKHAAFRADGRLLTTAAADRTVRIWDTATGDLVIQLADFPSDLEESHFISARQILVAAHGEVYLREIPYDSRPLADLVRWAHVLGGHRLDFESARLPMTPLSRSEVEQSYAMLRAKYFGDFASTSENLGAWHKAQAEQWFPVDPSNTGLPWPFENDPSAGAAPIADASPYPWRREAFIAAWHARRVGDSEFALAGGVPLLAVYRAERRWQEILDYFAAPLAASHLPASGEENTSSTTQELRTMLLPRRVEALVRLGKFAEAFGDFDEIREAWRNVPAEDDPDLDANQLRQVRAKLLRTWLAALGEAVQAHPEDGWAKACRGLLHAQLDQWEPAIADFSAALAAGIEDPRLQGERGLCYRASGQNAEAVADLSLVLDRTPTDWRAQIERGAAWACLERWDEALADWTATLDADEMPPAWWSDAAEICDRAVQSEPRDWRPWAARGVCRWWGLENDEALKDFDRALSRGSQVWWVHHLRGRVFADGQNRWRCAEYEFSAGLDNAPDQWLLRAWRGVAHAAQSQWKEAIQAYDGALEQKRDRSWLWHNRGYAHRVLEHWDLAAADYAEAIRLAPGDLALRSGLAFVLIELKRYEEAIAEIDRALAAGDANWQNWNERAYARAALGQCRAAVDDTLQVVQRETDHDWTETVRSYGQALAKNPRDGWAYFGRALAHRQMNDLAQAEADFDRALALGVTDWRLWFHRGLTRQAQQKHQAAAQDFTAAVEHGADDWRVWYGRGDARLARKQWNEAYADYSEAMARGADDWRVWTSRAAVLVRRSQIDDALEEYETAASGVYYAPLLEQIELIRGGKWQPPNKEEVWGEAFAAFDQAMQDEPQNWRLWFGRGRIYFDRENWVQAGDDFAQAIQRGADDANVWRLYGDALRREGQMDEAVTQYSESLRRFGYDHSQVLFHRGVAYETLEDWAKAEADFTTNLNQLWKFEERANHCERGIVRYRQDNFEGALEDLNRAAELLDDPDSQDEDDKAEALRIHYHCGLVHEKLDQANLAIEDFTHAIEAIPSDSNAWFRRGILYLNGEEWRRADEDFTQSIVHGADVWVVWYFRAQARQSLGRHEEALADFDEARRRQGEEADEADYLPVVSLLETNRLDEAERITRLLIAKDEDDPAPWLVLGQIALRRDRLQEAEQHFTTAIAKGAGDWDTYWRRGVVREVQDDDAGAEADFRKATELGPKEPKPWESLGSLLWELDRSKEALAALTQAIDNETTDSDTWYYRGSIHLELGEPEKALEDFTAAVAADSPDPWAWYERGKLLAEQGELTQAKDDLDHAVSLLPENPLPWAQRGDVMRQLGRWNEALDNLNHALAIDPELPLVILHRGVVLQRLERFEEAEKDYSAALSQLDAAPTRLLRGDVRLRLRNWTGALEDYAEAARQDSDRWEPRYGLGSARIHLRQFAQAEADLDLAIARNPDHADARARRGLARAGQRHAQEAVEDFLRAAELGPIDRQTWDWSVTAFRELPSQQKNDPWTQFGLALALAGRDEHRPAAEFFAAAKTQLKDARLRRHSAATHFELKAWDAAIDDLTAALQEKPSDATLLTQRALAYLQKDDWRRALEDAQQLTSLNPGHPAGWYLCGRAHGPLGEWELAVEDFKTALEHSGNPTIAISLADAYVELDRYDEAETTLAGFLATHPDDVVALAQLAHLKLKCSDTAGYRELCDKLLEKFADVEDPQATNTIAWICTLQPEATSQPAQVVALARRAVEKAPDHVAYPGTLGAALYRHGQYEEAVETLSKSALTAADAGGSADRLYLAMALFRQGQSQEAMRRIGQELQASADQSAKTPFVPWSDRVMLELLRREAVAAMWDSSEGE